MKELGLKIFTKTSIRIEIDNDGSRLSGDDRAGLRFGGEIVSWLPPATPGSDEELLLVVNEVIKSQGFTLTGFVEEFKSRIADERARVLGKTSDPATATLDPESVRNTNEGVTMTTSSDNEQLTGDAATPADAPIETGQVETDANHGTTPAEGDKDTDGPAADES